jgi:redox-sensitive bicupin YhaK (pirin superfamily)
VFLYLVSGEATVNDVAVATHTLVELGLAGDELVLETTSGARFLFGHGEPIDEPVFSYGPFVMTSEAEIRQAMADYQAGKFGAVPG